MESMGDVAPFIDPELMLMMNTIFFVGTLISALFIMFPAFIFVRADHKVTWSWAVVFIPLFIIDAFLLFMALSMREGPGEDDEDDAGTFSENRNETFEQRQRKQRERKRKSSSNVLTRLAYFALFLIFQIFIVLRLNRSISWSWGIVFIPWFLLEAMNFGAQTRSVLETLRKGTIDLGAEPDLEEQEPPMRPLCTMEKIAVIYDSYISFTLRIIQVGLLVAKFNGSLDAGWGVVFLPTWLWSVAKILGIVLAYISVKRTAAEAGQPAGLRSMLLLRIAWLAGCAFFLYLGTGLLVRRLQNDTGTPSAAVILIPIFIIFGLLFCCLCCCLPCVVCCLRRGLEAELAGEDEIAIGELVASDKRITYMPAGPSTS